MVRIAIVDDDCESVKKMEQQITNSVELKQIISVISNYSDGESLRESIDSYDVFFLDIDMPRLDGISLAKGIRKLNSLAIIIFMTNRNDLMHVSFAVQPFYFIRKSNFEDDCKILFPLLIERLNKIKKKILLMINGRRKIVEIASIVYIESYNHHIHMHIKNGEVMILKNKLSDILLEIGLESIVQIHKSYLVNMAYIDYLYGNTVYLKDNKSLPLGRKFKDSVKIKYEWYLML